jgi:hypothetical protein
MQLWEIRLLRARTASTGTIGAVIYHGSRRFILERTVTLISLRTSSVVLSACYEMAVCSA